MLFWKKKRDVLARSVAAVVEALEDRRYLTVTLTPSSGIKVPTTAGAIIKPWVAVNGGNPAPDPGMEELIAFQKSPANPNVEAMLVQVNHWKYDANFPYLTTPDRLYLSADGGTTWHERDFNTSLDGWTDLVRTNVRVDRPDSSLAFDPSGNLYVMALSEGSSLLLDRITVANISIVTSGGTLGQLPAGDTTSLWPRMATQSAVVGGWIHLNLTATAIPSLDDRSGPNHANYTGLAVYNG